MVSGVNDVQIPVDGYMKIPCQISHQQYTRFDVGLEKRYL